MLFKADELKEGKKVEEFIEQNELKRNQEQINKTYKEEFRDISLNSIVKDFASRLIFSFEKSKGCRGISAGFNIEYLQDFFVAMGRDDLAKIINDDSLYDPYGAPAIIEVCDKLNIEVSNSFKIFAGISYDEHRALGHC